MMGKLINVLKSTIVMFIEAFRYSKTMNDCKRWAVRHAPAKWNLVPAASFDITVNGVLYNVPLYASDVATRYYGGVSQAVCAYMYDTNLPVIFFDTNDVTKMTSEENTAMIIHELGHAVDFIINGNTRNASEKEAHADIFAINLLGRKYYDSGLIGVFNFIGCKYNIPNFMSLMQLGRITKATTETYTFPEMTIKYNSCIGADAIGLFDGSVLKGE